MPRITNPIDNRYADGGALDDSEVVGGYKVVADYSALEALATLQLEDGKVVLKNGCAVYVATGEEKGLYRWKETNTGTSTSYEFVKDDLTVVETEKTTETKDGATVDTYTVTMSNGSSFSFEVVQGSGGGSAFTGTIDDSKVIGGYKVVQTNAEMQALLNTGVLKDGCKVFVKTENTVYQYDVSKNAFTPETVELSGTVDESQVIGGYRVVNNETELAELQETVRNGNIQLKNGSPVYVVEKNIVFRWNSTSKVFLRSFEAVANNSITIDADGYWCIDGEKTSFSAVGLQGIQGLKGDKGDRGLGIKGLSSIPISITGYGTDAFGAKYLVYMDDANNKELYIPIPYVKNDGYWWINDINTGKIARGEKGEQGAQGLQGEQGEKGATGAKVVSIELIDQDENGGNIYKQTFDDGTTAEFTAPRGEKGEQGEQGATGAKVVSTVLIGIDANGGYIYQQTFDNGTTAEFTAPRGKAGDVGINVEDGTGVGSIQQVADGVELGFDFTGRNAKAEEIDPTLSAVQPYGGANNYSASFGGINSAQGSRSFAMNNKTIAKGDESLAQGYCTVAFGGSSFAGGVRTVAGHIVDGELKGEASHAEGVKTWAKADASHAEGQESVASGIGSHAEGYANSADGDYSHAEGVASVASGIASHAEGNVTTTNGNYSHAEGSETIASGIASHAEGINTRAVGEASHAEGSQAKAMGDHSHAGGVSSRADGYASFVHGVDVKAEGDCQFAVGICNENNIGNIFEVGNGNTAEYDEEFGFVTKSERRSNAFAVTRDGRAKVNGKPVDDNDVLRKIDLKDIGGGISTSGSCTLLFPANSNARVQKTMPNGEDNLDVEVGGVYIVEACDHVVGVTASGIFHIDRRLSRHRLVLGTYMLQLVFDDYVNSNGVHVHAIAGNLYQTAVLNGVFGLDTVDENVTVTIRRLAYKE